MNKKIPAAQSLLLLGVIFSPIWIGAARPQAPGPKADLPSVDSVMSNYVGALGGRQAIFKHKSMMVTREIDLPGGAAKIHDVQYYYGRKTHEDAVLPNGSHYLSGYDGVVAWEIPPNKKPAIITGDEAKSVARDADMYYPARIMEYFDSMEVIDIVEFAGRRCYHLKGTNKWGKTNEQFYDVLSGLLVGYRFNSSWRGGEGDESVVFSDYRDFGGWLMPTKLESISPKRTVTVRVISVTFDDVGDSMFNLPAEVKALAGAG